jgi:hypothetical protein
VLDRVPGCRERAVRQAVVRWAEMSASPVRSAWHHRWVIRRRPESTHRVLASAEVLLVGLFSAKDADLDTKLDLLTTAVEAHGVIHTDEGRWSDPRMAHPGQEPHSIDGHGSCLVRTAAEYSNGAQASAGPPRLSPRRLSASLVDFLDTCV